MITVLIQAGMSILAGFALWKMWRAIGSDDRWVRGLVFVGFVGRAFAGTILFWISWLSLPIFSRVQMGNGHWFFATDGKWYLREAVRLAEGGLPMIVRHDRTGASVSYVQTLATFTMLFGNAASVALLVNLLSYLGMCLIILKWLKAVPSARIPALIALAAVSLSPSAILWSTQPLKDTFFQFLIVCLIAAGAAWQRSWLGAPAPRAIVGSALVMIAALFMVSGIRWYFGLVVLFASGAFFLITAVMSRHRWRALGAGVVTLFLLSQSLVISASAYLPPYVQKALMPWKASTTSNELSADLVAEDLKRARQGFENSGGATSIGVGGALARIDQGRRVVPVVRPVSERDFAEAKPDQGEPLPKPGHAEAGADLASRGRGPVSPVEGQSVIPAVEVRRSVPAESPRPEAKPARDRSQPRRISVSPAPEGRTAKPVPSSGPTPPDSAPAVATRQAAPVVIEEKTPSPAPATTTAPRNESEEGTGGRKPAPVVIEEKTPSPAPATTTAPRNESEEGTGGRKPAPVVIDETTLSPAPATTIAPRNESEEETGGIGTGVLIMPTSTTGRLLAGAAAVLLPSGVSREMGLLQMGGGRGFWWFTDLDSIVFDLMVIVALVFMVRRDRGATVRNPILWFVLLLLAVVVPIAYTITNYGTLFRLRAMLFVTMALIPLAISNRSAPETTDADVETEPPAG
ncbi:MAG: hypothetical protein ABI779_04715 [Acidobacteriota bacterium]